MNIKHYISARLKATQVFKLSILVIVFAFSTTTASAQSWTGPSEVCHNVAHTFTYSDDVAYNSVNWSVGGGATIVSGSGLSRSIRFTSNGSITVSMYFNGMLVSQDTKYVSVYTPGTISAPAAICVGASANITSSNYIGSTFNWQFSTNGGSTWNALMSAGPSINVSPATTTWYRSTICGAKPLNYSVSNVIQIAVNPLPTPSFTAGPAVVCAGSGSNVYSTQAGMNNYVWSVSAGGTITAGGGSGSNSVTVTWNSAGARTVSVNYTNGSGCTAASPTVYNVTVNSLPVPTFTAGPTSVCSGANSIVYATEAGMSNYAWSLSGGGIVAGGGGSGSNTITINWSTPGTHAVSVSYTGTNGCTAGAATVRNVTVNALPVPTFTSGPTDLCTGSTGVVYTTEAGMSNYNWSVSGGGTVTSGGHAGSNTVTVNWNNSGAQSVSVSYTNGNGCTAATPTVRNVTVNPLPVPTFTTGPASVCENTGGHVYTTQAGMSNYVWSVSAGGTITSGGGSGSNSVTVTWNTAGARTVSVNYTNLKGCTAPSPSVYNVNVNSLPVPTFTAGPTVVCAGATSNVYTTEPSMSNYVWTVSPGGTITAGGGTGSNSVTITWSAAGARSVSVSYTNGNGCTAATPTVRNVTVNALPTPTFTGGVATTCAGATANVYTTQAGMSNYVWSVSAGGTITAGGGAGNNTATVTWHTAGAQSISVSYTNGNGCTATTATAYNVSVNSLPVPTFTTGPASACAATSGHVYTTQAGMSNYVWSVSAGGTITSGGGTANNSVTITWNAAGAGTVGVAYTNGNGCTTASPTIQHVNVNALPTTYAVGGTGAHCAAATVTLAGSQSGIQYQLRLNGNNHGSAVAGNGNQLTWNGLAAGTYTVVANNLSSACVQTMTGNAVVSIDPLSNGGLISPSNQEFYTLVNSGAIIVSAQTGTVQRWEKNTGGAWSTISNTSLNENFTNLSQSTTYRAVVKSGVCAEAYTPSALVKIFPAPAISYSQEFIPYGGSSLLSTTTPYASYQWYKNNTLISGATASSYQATEPGNYTVSVSASGAVTTAQSPAVNIKSSLDAFATAPVKGNLLSTTRILTSGVANVTSLYALAPDELQQTITYMDGYGRTYQVVGVGQSADQKDIVQPVGYSAQGLVEKNYLPYVAAVKDGVVKRHAIRGDDAGNTYEASEQYTFYTTSGNKIATDAYPFTTKVLAASPLLSLKEQSAPGAAWQPGSGHTQKFDLVLNVANQVRYWKADGTTNSYYPANMLMVNQVTDENGNQVKTFTDKMGRLILKQVQLDEVVEGINTPWLETYSIYDVYGRLIHQVPPKAMQVLGTGGTLNLGNTAVAELIYTYTYDSLGRLIEKKEPGALPHYIVYDKLDRVVLTQDGEQRLAGHWAFVKYDDKDRVVYTGIYTNNTSRTNVQNLVNALDYAVTPWYEKEEVNATYFGYSNQSFPTSNLLVLGANYYDHYDFDRNGAADYAYDAAHVTGQEAAALTQVRNLATGSRKVIINGAGTISANSLVSIIFYDAYRRPIQSQANNHLYATVADKRSMVYDFSGKLLKTRTTQSSSASTSLIIDQRLEYDHAGRTKAVYQTIDQGSEIQVAAYDYNALGQLVDKKLHSTDGTNFLQSIDYRYNIRGWLSSINNAELSNDGQRNDDSNDYFGMEFVYNTANESGLTNAAYYNGNIAAIKWKEGGTGTGVNGQRAYTYNYGKSDQLSTANFKANTLTGWNKQVGAFNESLSYDVNGNIKNLVRSKKDSVGGVSVMDNLSYTYVNGNQLNKVEDAATAEGFNNGTVNGTNEYAYNNAGQLTQDQNKGISQVQYNVLGKVQQVSFTDGRQLSYAYDASGQKLSMSVTQGGNTNTTDYVGNVVYENNTLAFFGSPEGRIVKVGNAYDYQYAIADHQGNTRLVFSAQTPTPEVAEATMETAAETAERGEFLKYDDVRKVNAPLFDHTNSGTTQFAVRLTASVNERYGLAKSIAVAPGDKIKAEVFAKFVDTDNNNWTTALNDLVTAIASGTTAPGTVVDGSSYGTPAGTTIPFAGQLVRQNDTGTGPKAYLNWLVFDKSFEVIASKSGFRRLSNVPKESGTDVPHEKLEMPEVTIEEAGYVYIYFSNENETFVEVYFDDFSVTHTPTNIVQYNEYYPFGLQTVNSWSREEVMPNAFLYNGGSELNSVTNNYEMFFREYDPTLGRMNAIDPMASKYASLSPYNYAFNDPVYFNDPSGADPAYQRADDTWWTAPRFNRGRFSGFDNPRDFAFQNQAFYPGNGGFSSRDGAFSLMGSGANYGPDYYGASQAVMNGTMTMDQYVAEFSPKYGAGSFVSQHEGKTYGGNYHTTNGKVTSMATSLVVQVSSGGYIQVGNLEILDFEAAPSFSDVFFNPMLVDAKDSDFFTMSGATAGMGTVAWAAEKMLEVHSLTASGGFYQSASRVRGNMATGAKFMRGVVGPTLGLFGVAFSTVESIYDANGYTVGDLAKTSLGVLMVVAAFNPVTGALVAAYALADIAVGVTTGYSITDRLGTAIDHSLKH